MERHKTRVHDITELNHKRKRIKFDYQISLKYQVRRINTKVNLTFKKLMKAMWKIIDLSAQIPTSSYPPRYSAVPRVFLGIPVHVPGVGL